MALLLHMPMQDNAASSDVVNLGTGGGSAITASLTKDISVHGPGGFLPRALHFSASPIVNIYVSPFSSSTPNSTVEFWAKRDRTTKDDYVWGVTNEPFTQTVWFDVSNKLKVRDAAGVIAERTLTGVDTTKWHHYALVHSLGVSITLYVDGALAGTFTNGAAVSATVDVSAVGHDDGQVYFDGALADFRHYDVLRTGAQIRTDYLLVVGGTMGTPVAKTHRPAANTLATVTFNNPGGTQPFAVPVQYIQHVSWSYNAAPTGGNIVIESPAGQVIWQLHVTAAGPDGHDFEGDGLPGAPGEDVVVALAAAGAAVVGTVNAIRR